MTSGSAVRTALMGLALVWAAIAAAQPITVAGLQRLLQEAPKRELRFQETRESPWLAVPVEASGSMKSSATMLEKQLEHPRRETWRILVDRLQLITPGSTPPKQFMFSQAPAVAALADRVDGAAHLESGFFGRPASFPIGPHVLAARAGASVLMCFGLYEGGANYRIEFVEFGPAAPRDSRGAALQPVANHYASLLEQYARRYPKNWFNFYPSWAQR